MCMEPKHYFLKNVLSEIFANIVLIMSIEIVCYKWYSIFSKREMCRGVNMALAAGPTGGPP